MSVRRLSKILLYDEGTPQALNIGKIAEYLRGKLGKARVELKGDPFAFCCSQGKSSDYASRIASIKIQDTTTMMASGQEPLYGEIQYEKRRISGKTRAFGILYDGFQLQRIFCELIPGEEHRLEFVHIFFTNRLFATWDQGSKRYHARVSIYGIPSVISTTGLVEAPARPREYYLLKQQYEALRKDLLELKDGFKGSFIDYEDERLTEVMKGYAMQAVFYALIGDPFCEDKGCRLYNAHWQEELIFAQLGGEYEFCLRHRKLLEDESGYREDRG
jgi:hypothetical protein